MYEKTAIYLGAAGIFIMWHFSGPPHASHRKLSTHVFKNSIKDFKIKS